MTIKIFINQLFSNNLNFPFCFWSFNFNWSSFSCKS
jgi:hypothetical protein